MNPYKKAQSKLKSNPITGRLITDIHYRTTASALVSLGINIAFAAYNCFLGITTASAWFVTMCIYYMLLGFMRFHTVLFSRKNKFINAAEREKRDGLLMKRVGIFLLFLPLALSGTVVLTSKQHHVKPYGTIVMITIAAYTFYKIAVAIIGLIKIRKQHSPLLSTIRNISIADAAMSILPMQSSMIASFDNSSDMDFHLMTVLTGSGICIIFLWLGITMIIHGGNLNGKIKTCKNKSKNS